jgi:hypothetical protein
MKRETTKRTYQSPTVKSIAGTPPPVLLICTGVYNCVNEVGYDCCAPSVDNCFDPGQC